MPFNVPALNELRQRVGADLNRHAEGNADARGSIEYAVKHSVAGVANMLHGRLGYMSEQIFTDSADEINLMRQAADYKITRIPAVAG